MSTGLRVLETIPRSSSRPEHTATLFYVWTLEFYCKTGLHPLRCFRKAAVAYLETSAKDGRPDFGFILGKAKVAPTHGHTIPRLELYAAVMAVELANTVCEHLDLNLDSVQFYTDSRIVLGYICNTSKRFYVYVANRVERIHLSTRPDQWHYVSTTHHPAVQATS